MIVQSSCKIVFYKYWKNIYSLAQKLGNVLSPHLEYEDVLRVDLIDSSISAFSSLLFYYLLILFSSHPYSFLTFFSFYLYLSFSFSLSFLIFPSRFPSLFLSFLLVSPLFSYLSFSLRPWWNLKQTIVQSSSHSNKGTYILL